MLHLDYSDVRDWEELIKIPSEDAKRGFIENPYAFTMGIYMMHVGINKLTTKNADEFYARCQIIDACFGGGLHSIPVDDKLTTVPMTVETVERWIGLGSNASSYTEAQFFSHVRKDCMQELRRHYKHMQQARGVAEAVHRTLTSTA